MKRKISFLHSGLIISTILSLGLFQSCGTTEYYPPQRSLAVYDAPPVEQSPPYSEPTSNYEVATSSNPGQVNYQTFYDALSPYGVWTQDQYYGYVWIPNVGPDFQPYQTYGHWVYTGYGWTWVSDYQWGWATFHYGRWRHSDENGWVWIPGYTWGPAWVAWRSSGSFYGWAPLGPPAPYQRYQGGGGDRISIGLSFSYNDAPEASQWCFVPANQVASPQINNYYIDRSRNTNIYNNTTIINNTTVVNNSTINNYNTVNNNTVNNNTVNNNTVNNQIQTGYVAGPPKSEVERITGNRINPISISNSSKPGATGVSGNSIAFYRPIIKPPVRNNNNAQQSLPAPKQTSSLNSITPVYNRRGINSGVVENNPVSNVASTNKNPVQEAKQQTFQNRNLINQGNPGIQGNGNTQRNLSNPRNEPIQNNGGVQENGNTQRNIANPRNEAVEGGKLPPQNSSPNNQDPNKINRAPVINPNLGQNSSSVLTPNKNSSRQNTENNSPLFKPQPEKPFQTGNSINPAPRLNPINRPALIAQPNQNNSISPARNNNSYTQPNLNTNRPAQGSFQNRLIAPSPVDSRPKMITRPAPKPVQKTVPVVNQKEDEQKRRQ